MPTSFNYTTTYVLDKTHFSETFDESATPETGIRAYAKAIILAMLGLALLYVAEFSGYFAWFLIGLGVIEGLSVRFKKPWWLARQMLSRAANNKVTLSIDEHGIKTESAYVDSTIAWENISHIQPTERGWLLYQGEKRRGPRSYLSNRCLSDEAIAFIRSKAEIKCA